MMIAPARCPYPDCPNGSISPKDGHPVCVSCARQVAHCFECEALNRPYALYCTACGKLLTSNLNSPDWPAGNAPPGHKWTMRDRRQSALGLLTLDDHVVTFNPGNGSFSMSSSVLNKGPFTNFPFYQQSGSQLTAPLLLAKYLIWSSSNGIYCLPVQQLIHAYLQQNVGNLQPLEVIGGGNNAQLQVDRDTLYFLNDDILTGYNPANGILSQARLPAPGGQLCSVDDGMLAYLLNGHIYLFAQRSNIQEGKGEFLPVAYLQVPPTQNLTGIVQLEPQDYLLLFGSQPYRLLIQPSGPKVLPLAKQAGRNYRQIRPVTYEGKRFFLLPHESGWDLFDPTTREIARDRGVQVKQIEVRPALRVIGEYCIFVHMDQSAQFVVDIYSWVNRRRHKVIPGYSNIYNMALNDRWITVLGDESMQLTLGSYELCRSS